MKIDIQKHREITLKFETEEEIEMLRIMVAKTTAFLANKTWVDPMIRFFPANVAVNINQFDSLLGFINEAITKD